MIIENNLGQCDKNLTKAEFVVRLIVVFFCEVDCGLPDIPTASLQALLAPSSSGWLPNTESSFYRFTHFYICPMLQSLCKNSVLMY